MEEFLNNLYSYEYFGFYLILSIIILIILFVIILFFGKKDQKVREIEATKKLQQINSEAFKEENNEEKLEINNNETLENTIVVPSIEDVPTINNVELTNEIQEPVMPVVEEVVNEIPVPTFENIETRTEEEKIELPVIEEQIIESNEEPLLERIEEKPFAFDNTNIFNNDFQEQIVESVVEQTPVEEPKSTESEIEVPEFNFDEIVKDVEEVKQNNTYTKGPQIFSSVYVPEKKEETIELKEEIKVEEPVEEKIELVKPAVDEELDFELPTLKKEEVKEEPKFEEKIEMPVLNDYNLDELSGETYTINK